MNITGFAESLFKTDILIEKPILGCQSIYKNSQNNLDCECVCSSFDRIKKDAIERDEVYACDSVITECVCLQNS